MSDVERRMAALEIRAGEDDKPPRVEGYAAVFGQETEIAGLFREVIEPGAFRAAIERGDDVVLLVDHEGQPLARTRSGTLELREDDQGLWIGSDLDREDPDVLRIMPKLRRGDLDKMSFAFRAAREEWDDLDGEMPLRRIKEVTLYDVSIVTRPAYDGTEVGLRSLEAARHNARTAAADWRATKERRLRLEMARLAAAAPAARP